MLGAPLLFAVELTILYAAGTYVMGHLTGFLGFGGGGSALGRTAFYFLVFPGVVLTKVPITWHASSPEPRSPASHHSRRVDRTMVVSCWATSVTNVASSL